MSFGVVGSLNYFRQPWVYTIFGATNAYDKGFETEDLDEFVWTDYRLDVPLSEKLSLSLGRQKEPISMERLSAGINQPMQERPVAADGLLPSRNFGAVLSGTSPRDRFSWAGGLFRDVIESDESWADTPTQIVGRVTWVPWSTTDDSHLIHLGLGYRHTDAKLGVRFRTGPEFNKAPDFVDTGTIDADNADLLNAEFSWRRGPYWLSAEYMDTRVDTPLDGTLAFNGYNVTWSWAITGEMRPYNRRRGLFQPLPVSRSVNQNGWGAWELALRWSNLDLVDGPIDGGEIEVLSLGVNWWLTRTLHVSLNLRQAETDRYGLVGDSTGVAGRILVMLD
jgi:phosphate-selective porin OprO/OprP